MSKEEKENNIVSLLDFKRKKKESDKKKKTDFNDLTAADFLEKTKKAVKASNDMVLRMSGLNKKRKNKHE